MPRFMSDAQTQAAAEAQVDDWVRARRRSRDRWGLPIAIAIVAVLLLALATCAWWTWTHVPPLSQAFIPDIVGDQP